MAVFYFLKGRTRCAIGTFQCYELRSDCFKRMKQLFQANETTVSGVWNNCFKRMKQSKCQILQW